MDRRLGRRTFVVSLAAFGGGALGVVGGQTYVRAKGSLIDRLATWLSDSEAARELGRAYLDAYPHERSAGAITAALRLGLDVLPFSVSDERLRALFHASVNRDFEQGRTVVLDGWVLSRTEIRLCGLAALRPPPGR